MSGSDGATLNTGRSFRPEFPIGTVVYLRLADEKCPALVTSYTVGPGFARYHLAWGDGSESSHYAIELTTDWEPTYATPED